MHDLYDLIRQGHWLFVECQACGHKAVLEPRSLRARCLRLGLRIDLEAVEARLRCGQFGCDKVYSGAGFPPSVALR